MNNLTQRTLSGAVYVAVVVASILLHPAFFGAVFLVVSMLAAREYMQLRGASCFLRTAAMLASGLLFCMAWWIASCMAGWIAFGEWDLPWLMPLLLAAYIVVVMGTLVSELFRKAPDPVKNWGDLLVSQTMIALPFALMNGVMMVDKRLLLALFVLIWLNDSGAYCVGSLLAKRKSGNHKMFPRVSPNKSWEGLIGGAVVAVAVGCLLAYFGWFDSAVSHHLTKWGTALLFSQTKWGVAVLFSLTVVVFGTLGDLMESLLKRTVGVKDSGRFMPGHGGVLDRFDSILLATPATVLLLWALLG